MKFILGGEFNYPSFNGIVTGLMIKFEKNAYI